MRIAKFFSTSVLATGVDYILYSILIVYISPTIANLISAGFGLVINYALQRKYVFNPGNSVFVAFLLSLIFSLFGLILGTFIIFILTSYTLLSGYPLVAKVISTGVIFFYNYFTKKIAFGHKEQGKEPLC